MTSVSAPNMKSSFCFRCENQPEKLIKSFSRLRSKGRFTDVILAADGKYLSAHRVILSAYSSYFEELLSLHMESQTIVFLQGVAFDVLQMLVDFMYKGEIEIESGKMGSFLGTAQSLKIRDLVQQGPEETAPMVWPSVDNAVDQNNLPQCPAGEEIQTEDSYYARENENLQSDVSENEENAIAITKEAQQYFKQEPKSFEAQDFNHTPSAFANNSPPLPDTSRSESSTPEPSEGAAASSSIQSKNRKPSPRTTRHGKTPNFVCQQCSKGYGWKRSLRKHQRLYCGKEPSFECATCDKRFYTKDDLKEHRDVVHNSIKCVCSRCSKSYKRPRDLVRHERFECGKEPSIKCVTCDMRFYRESNLKRHRVVHKSYDI